MDLNKTGKRSNRNLRIMGNIAIIALLVLALLVAACTNQQHQTTTSTGTPVPSPSPISLKATRTIIDTVGNNVTIPVNVKRIVLIKGACAVPSILTALGVGDKLAGGLCFKNPMQIRVQPAYTNYSVIEAPNGEANIETLLKLNPDVVFAYTDVKNVQAIRAAGIPVVVHDLSSWDSTIGYTTMVADVTGTQENATKLLGYLNITIKTIDTRVADIPVSKRKKVLSLSTSKPITVAGANSTARYLIEHAGGVCVTNNMSGYSLQIDMETLLNLDPDIIIVSSTSIPSYNDIMNNSEWDSVRAKEEGHVYLAPTGVMMWDKPGAEMPLFLLWETHIFYPDRESNDQLRDETKKFYNQFFRYNLSDEEYKMILNSRTE